VNDDLAEKFFEEKIAPGLRDKGITEERLQTVQAQFIADVINARKELAGYNPRIAWIEGVYVTKSGKLLTEADIDDENLRYVTVEGDSAVARSGWYRHDPATGSLTQVTDDEADGATAGRFFDDQILPGLLEDGMPADGIAHLRQRYLKDAVADRAAMAQLRELYG
jgi:hypothetical protein